ncbi:MAG: hypothetical protein D3918_15365, partial [Candidatus Electrothrix sp. AX2]|nr:hypothetical protein [Candidatus Electrothrix gigas]
QLSQTQELETSFLKNKFMDSNANIDGDADLSQVQGPPIAGTHRIRLSFVDAPNQQRTVGSASIVVLYKH